MDLGNSAYYKSVSPLGFQVDDENCRLTGFPEPRVAHVYGVTRGEKCCLVAELTVARIACMHRLGNHTCVGVLVPPPKPPKFALAGRLSRCSSAENELSPPIAATCKSRAGRIRDIGSLLGTVSIT